MPKMLGADLSQLVDGGRASLRAKALTSWGCEGTTRFAIVAASAAMMADRADRVDLWCVADHLRANSDFMAGWCTARPGAFQVLVDELGLDRVRAAQLMLCKTPRPNQYDHDLAAIAGAIGADPARLAGQRRRGNASTA